MKTKTLLLIVAAAISLASCGGCGGRPPVNYNKSIELKPHEVKIQGYLSNVLEVIDGSYKFDYEGGQYTGEGKIHVKLKSIGKGNAKDYGFEDGNRGPLYLTVCEANGRPLSDFSDIASDYQADGLLKDMADKKGVENWISFTANTYGGKQLPDDAASFIITSKKKEKEKNDRTTTAYTDDNDNKTSNDDDDSSIFSSDDEDDIRQQIEVSKELIAIAEEALKSGGFSKEERKQAEKDLQEAKKVLKMQERMLKALK
jgi:hypothetical protein